MVLMSEIIAMTKRIKTVTRERATAVVGKIKGTIRTLTSYIGEKIRKK
jgi:hypothetical protein